MSSPLLAAAFRKLADDIERSEKASIVRSLSIGFTDGGLLEVDLGIWVGRGAASPETERAFRDAYLARG